MRILKDDLQNILANSAPVTLFNLSSIRIDAIVITLEDSTNIRSTFMS